MAQASAPKITCDRCDFRPRMSDTFHIEDHDVTHIICYMCGHEWVE